MHALVQLAPIQFQLRFTRTARAHGKLLLSHIHVHADQARGKIFELRQFDLHLAFMALRAQRKNIQDQHGAVDHPRLDSGGEIAHLRGRQVVIENHQRRFQFLDQGGDLVHLAAAGK